VIFIKCPPLIFLYRLTYPLAEGREDTVAGNTVAVGAAPEESGVIPEAFVLYGVVSLGLLALRKADRSTYSSIGVQELLIFGLLEFDPDRLWIPFAMPLREDRAGLLSLVMYPQPTRRFWDEPGEEQDQSREEQLFRVSKLEAR
jgi:hypothetical protein